MDRDRGRPVNAPSAGSRIEIDAQALRHNIRSLKQEFAPSIMAMVVKADAYGHGVENVVPIAEEAGIDEFAVFSAHEAWHVLQANGSSRIQIMGHMDPEAHHWAAEHGLEPWVNDIADWGHCRAAAHAAGKPLRVHLEVETGMFRTGMIPENVVEVAMEAADDPLIEVRGLCTHLGGAESSSNADRIAKQLEVFHDVSDRLHDAGLEVPVKHVSSSSAALVDPSLRMDLVRVGIASYGMWPTPEVRMRYENRSDGQPLDLRRVMTWRAHVMAIQDVPSGAHVGYGMSYSTTRDTRIAIVPVGYGDGLSRGLSNAGQVLIKGKRCPIVGHVNMNMVQVDVGHVSDVECGDDAVLIGDQGDESIGIHSFAEGQEVVNYELMARLSQDIPRVVIDAS